MNSWARHAGRDVAHFRPFLVVQDVSLVNEPPPARQAAHVESPDSSGDRVAVSGPWGVDNVSVLLLALCCPPVSAVSLKKDGVYGFRCRLSRGLIRGLVAASASSGGWFRSLSTLAIMSASGAVPWSPHIQISLKRQLPACEWWGLG